MKYFKSLTLLATIYLFTAVLAFNTAQQLHPLIYPPYGEEQKLAPVVEDPHDTTNVIHIFIMILVATAIMLVMMRKGWGRAIKIFLFFSFFTGTLFTLSPILGNISFIITLLLILYHYRRPTNIIASTILLSFTLSGIAAYIGLSLGFIPALFLVVGLSVYDIIAVFITKHMVALAKGAVPGINMMFTIPCGERVMGLGAGDIVIPLSFCISTYQTYGIGTAITTCLGGLAGLILLFNIIQTKKDTVLPALPPIVAGLILGFITDLLLLQKPL